MPVIYDDPAAPEPVKPRIKPTAPGWSHSGEPLTVYSSQEALAVRPAIRYINQELGFPALRQTWYRPTANIVVRPTPKPILREYLDAMRFYVNGDPGPLNRYMRAGKSTQFISQIPNNPRTARGSQAVIFLNPPSFATTIAAIAGYPAPPPEGPASGLMARFLRQGELVPELWNPGPWIVAAHELGHGLGLTHYDRGWADPITGEERATITTGGYGSASRKRRPSGACSAYPTRRWSPLAERPFDDEYYRKKGIQVRRKLRASGSKRGYNPRAAAREILKVKEQWGWNNVQAAGYLGLSTRRIEQLLAQYRAELDIAQRPKVLSEKYRRMLEWDAEAFEEFFLEFSGFAYMPRHVKPWIVAFLRERNLLLNVPPRHAKSTFFMTWVPLWLICRDRNVQILLVSNNKEDAKTWALEVAGQLEHNQGLIDAFGRFKGEKEGDTKWMPNSGVLTVLGRTKTVRGGQFTVESRGMTTAILGREADFIFVDDPTKQEEVISEPTRKVQLAHLREQVFTRAEPQGKDKPGGRPTVIGQRVHLLDLFGELEKQEYERGPLKGQKLFHTEKYPAVLDWETRRVLWPERYDWDELMAMYGRVGGEIAFSTMYQQEPMPEGAAKFRLEWLEAARDWNRPAKTGPRGERGSPAFLPIVRVLSVDPSPTAWNALVVGDLLYDRQHFTFAVTEIVRMRADVRELQREVDRILRESQPDYFIFEESGFLNWFRGDPWFEALTGRVGFIRHHTGVNKHSMEYGLESLAGDFELGRISLPYGNAEAQKMTDMFIQEAMMYPYGDTTDMLMALWFPKPNRSKLAPTGVLPTRIKGGSGGEWSFMKALRKRKNSDDERYRAWQRDKARRQEEMSGVG